MSNGIDIVYIKRFEKLINNENFMNRCFTLNEIEYINSKNKNKLDTIAGIYDSKEAFLKSIKKGINDYNIKDIEVLHNENSDPYIVLHNDIKKDIEIKSISVSISHDKDYAIASVLISL